MESYNFEFEEKVIDDKVFVLIIYDIIDNKKRNKLATYLQSYGFRIQKSAFEAVISKTKYHKLIKEIKRYVTEEDSIRIYKIIGNNQIKSYGKKIEYNVDDIIIVWGKDYGK